MAYYDSVPVHTYANIFNIDTEASKHYFPMKHDIQQGEVQGGDFFMLYFSAMFLAYQYKRKKKRI